MHHFSISIYMPKNTYQSVVIRYFLNNISLPINYRGISLCNALCKLIDLIIIEKCDGYLYTSELQFAYKRDHSTMLCTAVCKETKPFSRKW